ncbi:hypothetical protein OJAV_G00084800 [Oryzias javanicus]|uniref:Uncharacterized protein n=1 Tax=Oryzias javanicus TaxID=123683 RepID=A0A437CYF2_ORYJA|nr:hypothetical protein OJAV_G00084800 [Oryzias javanicus]
MGRTQRTPYLAGMLMLWLLFFRESHASVKSPQRGFEMDTWESPIPGFEFMSQHQVSAVQPQAPHYPSVHSEMPFLTLGPKEPHKQKDQDQREEDQPILQPQTLSYQLKSPPWSPNDKEDTRPAGPDHRPLPLGYGYPQKPGNQVYGHQQRPQSQYRGYLKVSQPEVPSRQQKPQTRDHGYSQKPNSLALNQQQRTRPGVFSYAPKSSLEGPNQQQRTKSQSQSYFLKPPSEMPVRPQKPQSYLQKPQPEKHLAVVAAHPQKPGYVQKPLQEMPSNQQRLQPISDVYLQKPRPEKPSTQQRRPQVHGSTEKPEPQVLRHQKGPNLQSFGYPETPLQRVPNYQLKPQSHGYSLKPEAQVVKYQRTQVQSHSDNHKPQPEEPSPHRRPQGQSHQQILPSYGPQFLLSHYFQKSVPQTSSNQQGGHGHQLNSPSLPPSYQRRPQLHKYPVQEPGYQQNHRSFRHELSSEAALSDPQQNPSYLQRPTYQEPFQEGRSKQQKSSNKQDLQSERSIHQTRPLLQASSFVQGRARFRYLNPILSSHGGLKHQSTGMAPGSGLQDAPCLVLLAPATMRNEYRSK